MPAKSYKIVDTQKFRSFYSLIQIKKKAGGTIRKKVEKFNLAGFRKRSIWISVGSGAEVEVHLGGYIDSLRLLRFLRQ